jgi:hypothetical protein
MPQAVKILAAFFGGWKKPTLHKQLVARMQGDVRLRDRG